MDRNSGEILRQHFLAVVVDLDELNRLPTDTAGRKREPADAGKEVEMAYYLMCAQFRLVRIAEIVVCATPYSSARLVIVLFDALIALTWSSVNRARGWFDPLWFGIRLFRHCRRCETQRQFFGE